MKNPSALLLSAIVCLLIVSFAPTADAAQKWFPGHYMLGKGPGRINQPGLELRARRYVEANPVFRGYKLLLHWSEVEKSENNYDWTVFRAILEEARLDGRKVVIEVQERNYAGLTTSALPAYILNESIYEGGSYSHLSRIQLPKLWVPAVADRYIALLQSMAREFDSHPALAGIIFPEMALSASTEQSGYTALKFSTSIKKINSAAAAAFVQTPVTQWINWANGMKPLMQDEVMDHVVVTHQNGIGGPDVCNGKKVFADQMQMGRFYDKYRGVAHVVHDAQSSGFRCTDAQTIFNRAVDTLGAHIISWAPIEKGMNGATYSIQDVINVIKAENGRVNSSVPSNISRDGGNLPPLAAPTGVLLDVR